MRRLRILALTGWMLFGLWAMVFYGLWYAHVIWPHAAWAAVSLGSMIVSGLWLTLTCVREIRRRWRSNHQCRPWMITGWFILGMAPLAWFGAHWLDAGLAFRQRLLRPRSLESLVAQTWLSSFFEGVSRFRYQRTSGDHVVLLHSSDYVAPDQLVADMDQHISAMTKILGVGPPDPVAWVRGPMLGTTGVAIGPWSITDVDQDADALTSLDRHEVAHTVIGGLCGRDHHPPRLLVEGWAQFQSTDRSDGIEQLASAYQRQSYFKIDELIQEPWYSASRWPLYQYGGPFVTFLIERFSGEKFLRLYREARQDTFRDDAGRVMGVEWSDIESEFWAWLVAESDRIAAERSRANGSVFTLEFAEGVSEQDWETLVTSYREANRSTLHLPRDVSFVIDVVVDGAEDGQPFTRKLEAVFEGDHYWMIYDSPFGDQQSVIMGRSRWANVNRNRDNIITGVSGNDREQLAEVRQQANHLIQLARNTADTNPCRSIPIGPRPPDAVAKFRCESLQKPSDESSLWHMKYRKWMLDEESDAGTIEQRGEVWMDERKQFAITRGQLDCEAMESKINTEASYAELGGMIIPVEMTIRSIWDSQPASSHLTVHRISPAEASSVKRRAEQLASALVIHHGKPWFEYVLFLTYLMPPVGLCCIFFGRQNESPRAAETHL